MMYAIVAVYDSAMEAYGRPIFTASQGVALRSFKEEIVNPESQMSRHPEDYSLWYLGEYNETDGSFRSSKPSLIISGQVAYTDVLGERIAKEQANARS